MENPRNKSQSALLAKNITLLNKKVGRSAKNSLEASLGFWILMEPQSLLHEHVSVKSQAEAYKILAQNLLT
jgi:hypothetical protein